VVRVLAGIIMFAHGWQKLQGGPSGFGQALAGLVRLQDRFRVASYSSGHEISDLRTYALER
jgi:uncharacterized membrane protein YphA (DoxX/SURF4 family)